MELKRQKWNQKGRLWVDETLILAVILSVIISTDTKLLWEGISALLEIALATHFHGQHNSQIFSIYLPSSKFGLLVSGGTVQLEILIPLSLKWQVRSEKGKKV